MNNAKTILLIDLCWKKDSLSAEEFVKPIARIIAATTQSSGEQPRKYAAKHFSELTRTDIDVAEKIILCGTALKDNDFRSHVSRFEFLKKINKPVLGICAGMQVLALVFGGGVAHSKEIGMKKITTVHDNLLFSGEFEAYELHSGGIELPEEFFLLAKNEAGVQGMKHSEKEMYGIMFHPEVRNEDVVKRFIEL